MDVAIEDTEDRLAAGIIFIITFIGFTVSAFIVVNIGRLPMFRNPFGYMLRLQSIGDGGFAAVWAFYFAPALLFEIKALQQKTVAARFGQFAMACYNIALYSHLTISLNRFTAIYFPGYYPKIFTPLFVIIITPAIVVLSFCDSCFLVIVSCQMQFGAKHWMLEFAAPPCNLSYVYYAEFVRSLALISIFVIFDSLTFIRMSLHNRKDRNVIFDSSEQKKRRRIERRFVKQVTLQGAVFLIELISYFYVEQLFPVDTGHLVGDPDRWPNFIFTTVAWILVPTLDGLISLVFNEQLFRAIFGKHKSSVFRCPHKMTARNSLSS